MIIKSFRDLIVYQKGKASARQIFEMTKRFPLEEKYSLTDQIRRSSRAVNTLLAEAWGRRRYKQAFINKVNEALGEAVETQAWLDHSEECGFIDKKLLQELDGQWQEISAMLNGVIEKASTFVLQR